MSGTTMGDMLRAKVSELRNTNMQLRAVLVELRTWKDLPPLWQRKIDTVLEATGKGE